MVWKEWPLWIKFGIVSLFLIIILIILLNIFSNTGSVACLGKGGDTKDSCITSLAYRTKNPSVCDDATSQHSKDICYNSYAIRTNEEGVCQKVSEIKLKDNCYSVIAVNTGDENICKKVIGANEIGTMYKEICFSDVASKHQKPYVCDLMQEPNHCYTKVVSVDNPEICERITDQHYKDECYMNIVIDPYKCKTSGNMGCYEKGLNSYDTYCPKIQDESDRDKCYKEVSIRLNDPNICNNINYNPYSKETCFLRYYDADDISYCEALSFEQSKAICYQKYGSKNGDISACDKIPSEYTGISKTCYLDASEHEKNIENKDLRIEICKKITKVFYRDTCLARIPNKTSEECKLFSKEEDINYCLANV